MARSKSTTRRSRKGSSQPPPTWDEKVINRLMPYRVEILGIIIIIIAMVTLLALAGLTQSSWLNWWTNLLRQIFGWGAYVLCLLLGVVGLHFLLRNVQRPYRIRASQIVGLELILLTALPLSHQFTNSTLLDAYEGQGGGLVGWALSAPLLDLLGPLLTGFFYIALLTWGTALVLGIRWESIHRLLWRISQHLKHWGNAIAPPERTTQAPDTAVAVPPPTQHRQSNPAVPPPASAAAPIMQTSSGNTRRSRQLPPLSLLDKGRKSGRADGEIKRNKQIIENTLADFGIPAEVTQIRRGPAVTQYGVQPGYIERTGADGTVWQQKIRIGQIAALRRDLALALAVERLRIQAPVPGRGVVGIEVPNQQVSIVRLLDIVKSDPYKQLNSPLSVGLGRDVSGEPLAIDLAKMPHLLIAGTTGSGKSVCMNAFISCLVFNNTPEQLNLIMIDPKKVELIRFNKLPHLIGKVEVEADRAVGVLRWLTAEMDRRYEVFSQAGVRNLNGYNRWARSSQTEAKPLPYMAVFIDELADLMHMYPGDVERTLCRLAQMARATGIHLVVATQRPSTDVITGLIKANFPARLSFAVASGVDSRVILDTVGAEQLLGRGDGLFLSSDASGPIRIQGVFMGDEEIERIATFWQKTLPDHEPIDPPWETLMPNMLCWIETDTLLESAIELAQKHENISASFLQRRLRLGYPRAARIMEHLYEMGLVEDPKTGGKTRKTLTDEEDDPLERFLSER